MRFKQLLFLAVSAIVVVSTGARGQSLTGKWTAEYPATIRNVNGQSAEMGTAVISIEQKGDSIHGTWHAQNTPRSSEPRRIVGTLKGGQLSFIAEPVEARIRRAGAGDDAEQVVMMRSFFEAKFEGDGLVGTMYSKSDDGAIESQPLKWSAKRAAER